MKNKLKKIVLLIEEKCPFFGKQLVIFLRFLRFFFYYKPLLYFSRSKFSDIDTFKVYWINPVKIHYCFNGKINLQKDRGTIRSGEWDQEGQKFEETTIYKGIKARFIENKKWEDTKLYSEILKQIKGGKVVYGCHTEEKFKENLKKIDKLYNSIAKEGYKSQSEVAKENYHGDLFYKKIDEILVSIGRDGQLFFNDGAHRLAIAKILTLPKIPIMILERHKKWVNFKNELKLYAKLTKGKLYQLAYHFDLADIPFIYGSDRFELIKNNISLSGGKVIDIGANFGYLCHRFEKIGFYCCAVEINPQDVYFMQRLRDINNDKFGIIQKSIFDYKKDQVLNFDVVLALNIFHHFLKRKTTYEELKKLLRRLKCKEMFFGSHNHRESQMKGAFKNYTPEEFVKFILKNSCLNSYVLIKEYPGGRRLYKLYS